MAQEFASQSSYQYVLGNPISIIDPTGAYSVYVDGVEQRGAAKDDWEDVANEHLGAFNAVVNGVVVDDVGTIKDRGTTNRVVEQISPNTYSYLGDLGGTIKISKLYKKLLKQNMKKAGGIWDPRKFRNLVKDKGDWDFKNNKSTIYGLGNDGVTQFDFNGEMMEAQDIGNHHFGAVAQAFGFPLETSLRQAGQAQIRSKTSKPEWQVRTTTVYPGNYKTGSLPRTVTILAPPYGDDPRDQSWIKEGYNYARNR